MTGNPDAIRAAASAAGAVLARMGTAAGELAGRGGPGAAIAAAYVPGGPSREDIAAEYERLREPATGAPAA